MERTTGFEPATLTLAKVVVPVRLSPSQPPDVVSCPPTRPPSPSSPPIPYTGLPSRLSDEIGHWHRSGAIVQRCSSRLSSRPED